MPALVPELVFENGSPNGKKVPAAHGKLLFEEECQYWSNLGNSAANPSDRENALAISSQLELFRQDFLTFHDLSPSRTRDTVIGLHETIQELMIGEDLSEKRAANLAICVMQNVVLNVQNLVPNPLISPKQDIQRLTDALYSAIILLDSVTELANTQNSTLPHNVKSPYTFDIPTLTFIQTLLRRISRITTVCECISLVESRSLPDNGIQILKGLDYSSLFSPESDWEVENSMSSVDSQIAQYLTSLLKDSELGFLQHEHKFRIGLKRTRVQTVLGPALKVHMFSKYQTDLQNIDSELSTPVHDLIERIVWIRQCKTHIEEMHTLTSQLSSDLVPSAFSKLRSHVYVSLSSSESSLITDWIAEVESKLIAGGELENPASIGSGNPMLVLDYTDGKLHVKFPDSLGVLVRHVRLFIAMGYKLPSKLVRAAEIAQQSFRNVVELRQIANLYNTIDTQIQEYHKPLLLNMAVQFEKLASQNIAWRDPNAVRIFITQLAKTASELQGRNKHLQATHDHIIQSMVKILRYPTSAQWKSSLNEINGLLTGLGYAATMLKPWQTHLQMQLYKVLRRNYASTLREQQMSNILSEIRVDVTVKNGRIVLRPSIEEIKAKYYREVKKLICAPLTLKGIIDTETYSDIVEIHSSDMLDVYRRAESLFEELDKKLQTELKGWIIIWCLPHDKLLETISDNCQVVEDWEAHFRTIKQKGKDAELLGNTIKVENVTISVLPLKAVIDDHLQRFFDLLVSILHSRIASHAKTIQEYLDSGIALLAQVPSTVSEIAAAHEVHEKLKANDVGYHITQIQAKQKLLRSVVGSAPDYSDLFNQYYQFDIMVKGHELMIGDQFNHMMSDLDVRSHELSKNLSSFLEEVKSFIDCTDPGSSEHFDSSEYLQRLLEYDVQVNKLQDDCRFFNIAVPEFQAISQCHSMLEEAVSIQTLVSDFNQAYVDICKVSLVHAQTEDMISFVSKWKNKLSDNNPNVNKSTLGIHKRLDAFQVLVREWDFVLGDMKKFAAHHWSEFCALISVPPTHKLLLEHVAERTDLFKSRQKEIGELGLRARNESVIREALQEIEMWAVSSKVGMTQTMPPQNVARIQAFGVILSELNDQRSVVSSLQASPSASKFSDLLMYWEKRLLELDQCLRHLQTIQKKWAYMVVIISTLPAAQQHQFSFVDNMFRNIMLHLSSDPRTTTLLSLSEIQNLHVAVGHLEACQKSLLDFLEYKRNAFPRFYFIGDDDLLEILTQSAANPKIIQVHLKKLFSGLHRVIIENDSVIGIASVKGEEVILEKPIVITNKVDEWLSSLTDQIHSTLSQMLTDCITSTTPNGTYPEQISDLAYRIDMTRKIEEAIISQSLPALLSSVETNSYEAIYYGRVIEDLISQKVSRTDDFRWVQFVRFYFVNNTCVIRAFSTEFTYTFEYQGNPSKLVQTPLTDRCMATLTQAMSEGLGGCLFGPAGTGKTESVKHLGYLFGRQVLVFNCDEALDVRSITRLFSGITKCGAWGCFDEFNRLTSGVLAAVSNLVAPIQHALLHKSPSISINGVDVAVSPNSCLFVTLNPAGKNYKGRQQLPSNLKQLFRNISMTHPDVTYIAQIELKARGFIESPNELGQVVVDFFSACRQILSVQRHYDWGLRALKAVLITAGNMKQKLKANNVTSTAPDIAIMAQAMRLSTESKLTQNDMAAFQNLVQVYFGCDGQLVSSETFQKALSESYNSLGIPMVQWQETAAFQFSNSCDERMGVCLTGPPRSGKLTLVKLVADVWNRTGKKTIVHIASPKSMQRDMLLGYMNTDTREWHDGVMTMYSREVVASPEVHHLIVLDGDIDPEWVEALNSVLDDNKLLTMPNGERIKFESNVNFVFLTDSLQFVSPATVSRLAIVYLNGEFTDKNASTQKLAVGSLSSGRKNALAATIGPSLATVPIWIQCTRETTSEHIISALLQACTITTTVSGSMLVPSGSDKLVLCACDIDLPSADKYQSVQVHQFLHQLLHHNGFHHPKSLDWISLRNLQILCTSSTKNLTSARLSTKFLPLQTETIGREELVQNATSQFRQQGIDARMATKLATISGHIQLKSPLAAKKYLELVGSKCLEFGKCPDEKAGIFLNKVSSLILETRPEVILSAVTTEFGSVSHDDGSEIQGDDHDIVSSSFQYQNFVRQSSIALESSFPVILVDSKQGVPSLAAIHRACMMVGYKMSRVYYPKLASIASLMSQFKEVVAATGVRKERICLIIEPQICPTAEYYQVIHRLLARSAIEFLPEISDAEAEYRQSGYLGSLSDYVQGKCLENLRIVLVNVPKDWLNGFPLLVTRSLTLKWTEWDESTMDLICKPLKDARAEALKSIYLEHKSRSPNQLRAISTLTETIQSRLFKRLKQRQEFLRTGLSKLKNTKDEVDKLSLDSRKQAAELQDKQTQADSFLKQITETMVNVSSQKIEMEQLQIDLSKEETDMHARKDQIQKELQGVIPLLESAKSAVNDIKSEHLSEIRSLRAPPPAIRDVLEGVLRLLGQQDVSWAAMKSVLGKRTFKDDVLNFDASKIVASSRQNVEALIKQKPDSFVEANVKKSSVAAAPLAVWVTANLEYSRVFENVKPLQTKLDQVDSSLEKSRQRISDLNDAVINVDITVAKLKQDFNEKSKEAQILGSGLEKTNSNLERARKLLDTLLSEEIRWNEQLEEISCRLNNLDGLSLCCAMFCVWCSPFSEQDRQLHLDKWFHTLKISPFQFADEMAENMTCLANVDDQISCENVIIASLASNSTFWVADGNGQGLTSIRDSFSPKCVSVNSENYVKEVEMAIRLGHTIVLMDVSANNVHPWLYPIIRQEYHWQHGRPVFLLGEKSVEINKSFRIMLYSPSAGWEIPSELYGSVTQLCWSTTSAGLSARLLQVITAKDSPQVLQQLTELNMQEKELKVKLLAHETQLLQDLSASDKNILENEQLFISLMAAKEQGEVVASALQTSQKLSFELKGKQAQYKEMLNTAAEIYFMIRSLASFHPHYWFSLALFLKWFDKAVTAHPVAQEDKNNISPVGSHRMKSISKSLAQIVFQHIVLGTDVGHHVAFGIGLLLILGLISPKEVNQLCQDQISVNNANSSQTLPNWIPSDKREAVCKLGQVIDLKSLHENENGWKSWLAQDNNTPNSSMLGMQAFHMILLTQILIPDALYQVLSKYVYTQLGSEPLALADLVENAPGAVIMFVTPGASPDDQLASLITESTRIISLGQGMEDAATEQVQLAQQSGGLVYVQNLQALPSWIESAISLVQAKVEATTHPTFKLIISCEANTITIPIELLEHCSIMNIQVMPGFYRNLKHSLCKLINPPSSASLNTSSIVRETQLQFLISWLHVSIQERRHYVPQAWQKYYEFGNSDYTSLTKLIAGSASSGQNSQICDLNTLRGIGQLIYGGRIDVPLDMQKLQVLVDHVIHEDVINPGAVSASKLTVSKTLVRGFSLPKSAKISDFVDFVASLESSVKDHMILHLPSNIHTTVDAIRGRTTVELVKQLVHATNSRSPSSLTDTTNANGPKSASTNIQPTARSNSRVAMFATQWTKTFSDLPAVNLSSTSSPLARVVGDQLKALYLTINEITNTLQALGKSANNSPIAHAIGLNKTPEQWLLLSPQPTLTQFPKSVLGMINNMRLLMTTCTSNKFKDPVSLSMPSPSAFLTILQHMSATQTCAPIHTLSLVAWLSTCPVQPVPDVVLPVANVWLQGAIVQDGSLMKIRSPSTPALTLIPVINVSYVNVKQVMSIHTLTVPIFLDVSRETLIASVTVVLDTASSVVSLTLAGTALFIYGDN